MIRATTLGLESRVHYSSDCFLGETYIPFLAYTKLFLGFTLSTTLIGMSNLIPEKRVNKRGVAVTKHVRATPAAPKNGASMPAPALSGPKKPKSKPLTKKQLEPQYNTLLRAKYATDPDLTTALATRYGQPRMNEIFVFTCSDAEVYDVISAVGLTNAGALLDAGIRSGDEALKFLDSTGLEHLAADSSDLTTEALNRGLPSSDVLYMFHKKFSESGASLDRKLLLDSAEAHSNQGLRKADHHPPIPERVADGEISMDDLRIIGPTRYLKASGRNGVMLRHLIALQTGELDYAAEQIKETIVRHTKSNGSVDESSVRAELYVAKECGYEFASTLKNARLVAMVVQNLKNDQEETRDAAVYAETLGNATKGQWNLTPEKVLPLFKGGVDPMRAADHLEQGTGIAQIIAIESEGIAPSVSGGWL